MPQRSEGNLCQECVGPPCLVDWGHPRSKAYMALPATLSSLAFPTIFAPQLLAAPATTISSPPFPCTMPLNPGNLHRACFWPQPPVGTNTYLGRVIHSARTVSTTIRPSRAQDEPNPYYTPSSYLDYQIQPNLLFPASRNCSLPSRDTSLDTNSTPHIRAVFSSLSCLHFLHQPADDDRATRANFGPRPCEVVNHVRHPSLRAPCAEFSHDGARYLPVRLWPDQSFRLAG